MMMDFFFVVKFRQSWLNNRGLMLTSRTCLFTIMVGVFTSRINFFFREGGSRGAPTLRLPLPLHKELVFPNLCEVALALKFY